MCISKNGKRRMMLFVAVMIALIGAGFFLKHAAAGETATLNITSPGAGEYWGYKTTHDIKWTSSVTGSAIQIALCKQDKAGKYVYIFSTSPNPKTDAAGNGSYSWMVPAVGDTGNKVYPGSDYFIRISLGSNPDCYCDSANFSIGTPITVTAPMTADKVVRGSQVTVSWNYDKNAVIGDWVDLHLYYDNNEVDLAHNVSPGTDGAGSCKCTIPADLPLDKDYYIKVSSNLNADLICANSGTFSLTDKGNGSWANAVDGTGITGDGLTAGTAYQISSAQQLAYIAQMVNTGNAGYTEAYYKLTGNINLYAFEWTPIGNYDHPFTGHFEGNGYTITGLRIGSEDNPSSYEYAGFFGNLDSGASIIGLGITGASIHSQCYVGGLAGGCYGCTIENCYVTGVVTGLQAYVLGGLIGYVESSVSAPSVINNCHTDITVKGGNMAYIGGLIGDKNGTVLNSYSLGNIEGGGAARTGGLVGNNIGDISGSYSKCTVNTEGDSYIGGFVARHGTGRIYDCYSTGDVTGGDAVGNNLYIGAFVGYTSGDISNCYATGSATGGKVSQGSSMAVAVGGFVGKVNNKIENCYAAGNITGLEGALAGEFAGMNGGAGILVNTYWNMDSVQTVNGVIRNQADMLGCGDNTLVTCGLPADVMMGAKPDSFITYTGASGSADTKRVIGAFFIALNGGREVLTTGVNYFWWTPDQGSINNGYPVFTDTAYPVIIGTGVNGTGTASHVNATQGETVTLTDSPDAKYHLKEWTTDLPAGYTINGNTFIMPPQSVNITPVFEKDPPGKLTAPSKPSLTAGTAAWDAVTNENNGYSLNLYRNGSLIKTIVRAHGEELSCSFSALMTEGGSYTVTVTALGTGEFADSNASAESDPQVVTIAVTGVSLDKTNMNIYIGDSETLKAAITPDNATNKAVTWTSSNTAAATVDGNGKVVGISAGTAVITVTTADQNRTASCTVTVLTYTPAPAVTPEPSIIGVTGISLDRSSMEFAIGESQTLSALITPSDATDKAVTWSSSNALVAAVDNNGTVTGVSAGTATITAAAVGGRTAVCTVKVAKYSKEAIVKMLEQINVSAAKASIFTGENIEIEIKLPEALKKAISDGDCTYETAFSSSNKKAARVTIGGIVMGLRKGRTTITINITVNGVVKRFETSIQVKKPYIEITKKTRHMRVGRSFIFEAVGYGVDTSLIKWSTSEKSIVVIQENGVARAMSKGTDYVIASAGGVLKRIKVEVTY